MALTIDKAASVFDMEQVHKGDLIRAKHKTWDGYRNGVVVSVSEDRLIALYYVGYGNVSNHFVMHADEVNRGEWQAAWTSDLSEIFRVESEEVPEHDTGGTGLQETDGGETAAGDAGEVLRYACSIPTEVSG